MRMHMHQMNIFLDPYCIPSFMSHQDHDHPLHKAPSGYPSILFPAARIILLPNSSPGRRLASAVYFSEPRAPRHRLFRFEVRFRVRFYFPRRATPPRAVDERAAPHGGHFRSHKWGRAQAPTSTGEVQTQRANPAISRALEAPAPIPICQLPPPVLPDGHGLAAGWKPMRHLRPTWLSDL